MGVKALYTNFYMQLPRQCGQAAEKKKSRAGGFKALTKSTLCQTLRNLARQGNKLADKGAYINVSDCRLQVQLTQQAKIPSNLSSFEGIFAFAGFVSGLKSGGKHRRFHHYIYCLSHVPRTNRTVNSTDRSTQSATIATHTPMMPRPKPGRIRPRTLTDSSANQ